jgi:hypothetical protein
MPMLGQARTALYPCTPRLPREEADIAHPASRRIADGLGPLVTWRLAQYKSAARRLTRRDALAPFRYLSVYERLHIGRLRLPRQRWVAWIALYSKGCGRLDCRTGTVPAESLARISTGHQTRQPPGLLSRLLTTAPFTLPACLVEYLGRQGLSKHLRSWSPYLVLLHLHQAAPQPLPRTSRATATRGP